MADTLPLDSMQTGDDILYKKSEHDLFLEMISTDLSSQEAT
jgi:hypothetical protein